MDPNLIMRILQMARAKQAGGGQMPFSVGQSSAPAGGMMPPGAYGAGGGGLQSRPMPPPMGGTPPQGQGMSPGIGSTGFAPPGQGPSPSLYGSAPGGLQNQQMPLSQMFQPPPPQTEMALQGAGGQPMNPMLAQIMRHLGMLNMLRNRSAQPFMATEGQ